LTLQGEQKGKEKREQERRGKKNGNKKSNTQNEQDILEPDNRCDRYSYPNHTGHTWPTGSGSNPDATARPNNQVEL